MLRTEQRSQPRITTRLTVETVGPTLNISGGGMCILMADPVREGMTPRLTFCLPDDPDPVVCKGRITGCRTASIDPELYEVGLMFTDIGDRDRQRVTEFVEAHMSP